jgi:hypothetical protein
MVRAKAAGKRGCTMNPYDDNTTRNTIDGRNVGGSFDWDFNRINSRYGRAASNAVVPSTYQELYYVPRRRVGFTAVVIAWAAVAVLAYVATFEIGLFDGLYLWLTN